MRADDFARISKPARPAKKVRPAAPIKEITPDELLADDTEQEYFDLGETRSSSVDDEEPAWVRRLKAVDPVAYNKLINWD